MKATRWYFNGLKKEERPMAAARLASKLMQSENVSIKRLIMKLDPDEFKNEASVEKLLTYLENSPLGRMPIPDAGNKMAIYYRKLQRRRGEGVGAFLIREDHSYDEMTNALDRLVTEHMRREGMEEWSTNE